MTARAVSSGASSTSDPRLDPSGLPPVPAGGPGVPPLHAAAGAEYGEGFAGNAHRHAPESWLAAVKYLVEEIGADVNARDDGGYTPLHHAAARGDVEVINYLVSKGADVKAVSRRGQTTADMANGPVSRISPYPETIALLVKLGREHNKCASCAPVASLFTRRPERDGDTALRARRHGIRRRHGERLFGLDRGDGEGSGTEHSSSPSVFWLAVFSVSLRPQENVLLRASVPLRVSV